MSNRRFFEFRCETGHISEKLVYPETQEILCTTCDEPSQRIISTPRIALEGVTGAFPTAADAWARKHEEATRIARKRKADHSDPDA